MKRGFGSHVRLVAIGITAVPIVVASLGLRPLTLTAAASGGSTRQISSAGSTSFGQASQGSDGYEVPEYRGQSADGGGDGYNGFVADRSAGGPARQGAGASGATRVKSNPQVVSSFDGLFHRQQRLANGGNQFSVEPPDQGLCAGNGYVMEAVNDVTRVYDPSGNPLTGVEDLNTFFGYAPAIVRSTLTFGPFVTDPSCYFDSAVQRWFVTVLTIEVVPTGSHAGQFLGPNHLDIAVSQTASPTGAWTIYRLPAQDDGTQGTPNHACNTGPHGSWVTNPNACFGDYPHLGADANGFYVTTNEYSFFGPEFHGAQLYAFSKQALAASVSAISVTQFDLHGPISGVSDFENGFTLAPSTSPDATGDGSAGGTEYFLSSNGAAEATDPGDGSSANRTSTQIIVWALTNTGSLSSSSPTLTLSDQTVGVNLYANPPKSVQKVGSTPLRDCINDTACATFLLGAADPFAPEPEYNLDTNDTRMLQTTLANGRLWAALDTALTVNSVNQAGVEYFIVTPSTASGSVSANLTRAGYLGLTGNDVTYPAVGVTSSGRAVMAFTVDGPQNFPSAAYASLDAKVGVGSLHIVAAGAGPADGFSGYRAFANPPGFFARPRWGDYGATAVVGDTVFVASEYIGQTCTLAQYESSPFGSCGGTRSSLANWDTRISQLTTK